MKTTQLNFFRRNGKKYTFKTPIVLLITQTPTKDSGQFEVCNQEFGFQGTDYHDLGDAVTEAEKDFVYRHGHFVDIEDNRLTPEGQRKKHVLLDMIKSIEEDDTVFHNPIGDKIKPEYNFGKIKITVRNSQRTPEKRVILNVTGMKKATEYPDEYIKGYPHCSCDNCGDRLLEGYNCYCVQAENGKWVREIGGPFVEDQVWYVNNSDDVSVDVAIILIEEIGKCVERLERVKNESSRQPPVVWRGMEPVPFLNIWESSGMFRREK